VAPFEAVAPVTVVAEGVHGLMRDESGGLVAHIHGAGVTVVKSGKRGIDAADSFSAGFRTVAVEAVGAVPRLAAGAASGHTLVVHGTEEAVVAVLSVRHGGHGTEARGGDAGVLHALGVASCGACHH